MIYVYWQNHRTNEWVRRKTKVHDIIHIKARKWTRAGHIACIQDNRWTCQVTHWRPKDGRRSRGKPSKRWRDEVDDLWRSVTWKQNAQDRLSWKKNAEAFIQQVDWYWLNMRIGWWWLVLIATHMSYGMFELFIILYIELALSLSNLS